MGRRPLAPGALGSLRFYAAAAGRVQARANFRDMDGRLQSLRATAATEQAARQKISARVRLLRGGAGECPVDPTVRQYAQWWCAQRRRQNRVHPQQLLEVEAALIPLVSRFGSKRLRNLTRREVQSMLVELSECSSAAEVSTRAGVKALMRSARERGLVGTNSDAPV